MEPALVDTGTARRWAPRPRPEATTAALPDGPAVRCGGRFTRATQRSKRKRRARRSDRGAGTLNIVLPTATVTIVASHAVPARATDPLFQAERPPLEIACIVAHEAEGAVKGATRGVVPSSRCANRTDRVVMYFRSFIVNVVGEAAAGCRSSAIAPNGQNDSKRQYRAEAVATHDSEK